MAKQQPGIGIGFFIGILLFIVTVRLLLGVLTSIGLAPGLGDSLDQIVAQEIKKEFQQLKSFASPQMRKIAVDNINALPDSEAIKTFHYKLRFQHSKQFYAII